MHDVERHPRQLRCRRRVAASADRHRRGEQLGPARHQVVCPKSAERKSGRVHARRINSLAGHDLVDRLHQRAHHARRLRGHRRQIATVARALDVGGRPHLVGRTLHRQQVARRALLEIRARAVPREVRQLRRIVRPALARSMHEHDQCHTRARGGDGLRARLHQSIVIGRLDRAIGLLQHGFARRNPNALVLVSGKCVRGNMQRASDGDMQQQCHKRDRKAERAAPHQIRRARDESRAAPAADAAHSSASPRYSAAGACRSDRVGCCLDR